MSIISNELQGVSDNKAILQAIVKTLARLPTLEELGIHPNGNTRMPPVMQEKVDWYRALSASPRSLQHYSRCVIRDSLGTKRLKESVSLPLPSQLKDYLLLEYNEYR